ncbi:hypothetical protein HDU97_003771 [Phlyctochytrium planicorne]|nr:hypothetical protein HDU97_003771 [Phlyctochytrium planicorne]
MSTSTPQQEHASSSDDLFVTPNSASPPAAPKQGGIIRRLLGNGGSSSSGRGYTSIPNEEAPEEDVGEDCDFHNQHHHHGHGASGDDEVTGTIYSSAINLTNTILGAGVLAMPGALYSVGLGLGVILIIMGALASILGLTLLSLCASRIGRNASFFAVSKMTYPSAALWFDLAIAIKCFGVSVSYLVIIRDLMPEVIRGISPTLPPDSLLLSHFFWVTVSIMMVSPFAFARRLDSLRYTSALALMALVYLVMIVVGYFFVGLGSPDRIAWDEIEWIKVDESFLKTVPIFVFAFTCHQNIFAVHNELVDNTVERVGSVIHLSIQIATAVYQVVGILGYFQFAKAWAVPGVDRSNVIQMYPAGPIITLGQFALAVLFLLSYPLQCHPARMCLDKVISWGKPTPPQMSWSRHAAITIGLLSGSFLMAVGVENLSTVLSLVGATGSTTICYILPGLLYHKMRSDLDARGIPFDSPIASNQTLPSSTSSLLPPSTQESSQQQQQQPDRRRKHGLFSWHGPLTKHVALGLAVFGVLVMVSSVSMQVGELVRGGGGGGGGGHLGHVEGMESVWSVDQKHEHDHGHGKSKVEDDVVVGEEEMGG